MNLISPFARRIVYFSVKDSLSAKRIADHLIKSPDDSIILPFSDQSGPLSREILSHRFGSLTVCERDDSLREQFQSHINKNFASKTIHVHPDDLIELSFQVHDEDAQRRCSHIVTEAMNSSRLVKQTSPSHTVNCDSHVKFLIPLLTHKYESSFLKNLYYQMSLRRGLCSDTLLHYYYLMSDKQFKYLEAKPSENLSLYRSTTVLYNTMFNVHMLDTFDLATSFEIKLNKIQKTNSVTKRLSYHKIHLVWLEPRVDIIDILDARSWMEFRFLVNQMMMKRKRLVLPYLMNWFENCGQGIVRLGITETTRSGDLDKEQFFELYLYLRDRKDYKNSTFLQAVECYDNVMPLFLQN